MPYILLYTRAFADDLTRDIRPVPGLIDVLGKQLDRLKDDPQKHQGSLQTWQIGDKINKSRIDGSYRMLWAYKEKDKILLLRAGEHDYINERASWRDMRAVGPLDKREWGIGNATSAPLQEAAPPRFDATKWGQAPSGPFARVPDGVLRLLGVPVDMLDRVRALPDVNAVFEMGLPSYANELLMELYTEKDLSVEDLLLHPHVLFRETVERLQSYARGEIRQLLLHLTPEQERLVKLRTNGPTLLKGVAGSGKTTVGVRKAMNEHADPLGLFVRPRRVLFTTYNKTLARSVSDMFEAQYGAAQAREVDVFVLHDWMHDYLGKPRLPTTADAKEMLKAAIDSVRMANADSLVFKLANPGNFLQSEINDVFYGRGIRTWEEYRDVSRAGRGVPLQEGARRVVFQVFTSYTERMAKAGLVDYGDLARRCLERMRAEKFVGEYDAVVVDEAQDLRPCELEVVHRLCATFGGGKANLILLADAAQSIYYRGVSWRDAGVNITGRTHILKRNFRNTRQVLKAAWSMMQAGGEMAAALGEELIEPDSVQKTGPLPEIVLRDGVTGQIDELCERVMKLCERDRVTPGDIAVLAPQKEVLQTIESRLSHRGIPCMSYKADDFGIFENGVKLITMHSAKGLEFPVVFLMRVEEGMLPWNQPQKSADRLIELSREENLQSWRRLLYVSMTRSAGRLTIMSDRAKPSQFLADIDKSLAQWK